jgi:hypothetical protein
MKGITWQRDSHSLFDYESRNVIKKNIRVTANGKINRSTNDIEFIVDGSKDSERVT